MYSVYIQTTTDHPVLLKEKGSKWKVFTEPQDSNSEEVRYIPPFHFLSVLPSWYISFIVQEEEGRGISVFNVPCTTERTEFDQSRRKKRREMKRHIIIHSHILYHTLMYQCMLLCL